MNRSRSQLDAFQLRHSSFHKPGYLPQASRRVSPITSVGHKYELKQKSWPKQTIESWFENHSHDDRRAVYSFLNTLYMSGDDATPIIKQPERRQEKYSSSRLPGRIKSSAAPPLPASPLLQRQASNQSGRLSRASRRDLGEILESLESLRPPLAVQDRGIQTTATPITVPLPNVSSARTEQKSDNNLKRPISSMEKQMEVVQPITSINGTSTGTTENQEENTKVSRRYLSHTWRVINPREDMEPNVRPENNSSSFFQYTKKVYPEYFFIHPDWY